MTDETKLKTELDKLNNAVLRAVKKRAAWIEKHLPDLCSHSIGDKLYAYDGEYLGTVRGFYGETDLLDPETLSLGVGVGCELTNPNGCVDNTSRHGLVQSENEYRESLRSKLERLGG